MMVGLLMLLLLLLLMMLLVLLVSLVSFQVHAGLKLSDTKFCEIELHDIAVHSPGSREVQMTQEGICMAAGPVLVLLELLQLVWLELKLVRSTDFAIQRSVACCAELGLVAFVQAIEASVAVFRRRYAGSITASKLGQITAAGGRG